MVSKAQMNGMRGVYLAAAELTRYGLITSPTSRSALGADILATTHDCNKAFSIQVKTRTTKGSWFMLGAHAKSIKSDSHFYVCVDIRSGKDGEIIRYYIVPSKVMARLSEPANPNWTNGFLINENKIAKYLSNWAQFGKPQSVKLPRSLKTS